MVVLSIGFPHCPRAVTAHSSGLLDRQEMCLGCAIFGMWYGCVLRIRSYDGTSSDLCQQLRGCRGALCHHPDHHGGSFNHAGLAPALCLSWALHLRHWEVGAVVLA